MKNFVEKFIANCFIFNERFARYRTQGIVVRFTGTLVKNIQENNFNKKLMPINT